MQLFLLLREAQKIEERCLKYLVWILKSLGHFKMLLYVFCNVLFQYIINGSWQITSHIFKS